MLKEPAIITPGDFEPENHFYPRVLNAHIHPLVRNLMEMGNARIASRFCHLHPEVDSEAVKTCLLYTSPSPRDQRGSRMPSSA